MLAVADKITKRVRGKGRGWVFTPKDFLDLGTRASVDMALSRLAAAGSVRRIGRGLYDYPKMHATLGALTPDTDSVAQAMAKQSDDKIFLSATAVLNDLGLSTQIPARTSYMTSGPSRTKKVAGRTIAFRKSRAPILDDASAHANAVLQAFAHLGRKNINNDLIQRCASYLSDRDVSDLRKSYGHMPGWMSDVVLKISAAKHG